MLPIRGFRYVWSPTAADIAGHLSECVLPFIPAGQGYPDPAHTYPDQPVDLQQLAANAVVLRRMQRGDDKARVGAFGQMLGFTDHPPLAAP